MEPLREDPDFAEALTLSQDVSRRDPETSPPSFSRAGDDPPRLLLIREPTIYIVLPADLWPRNNGVRFCQQRPND